MQSFVSLRVNGNDFLCSKRLLLKCGLFVQQPKLLESGKYVVQASVQDDAVGWFLECLTGENVSDLPMEHLEDLVALAREFQCSAMLEHLYNLRKLEPGRGLAHAVEAVIGDVLERVDDLEMRMEGMHEMVYDACAEAGNATAEVCEIHKQLYQLREMYESLSAKFAQEVAERAALSAELEAIKQSWQPIPDWRQSSSTGKPANLNAQMTEVNVPFTGPESSLHGIIHYLKDKCEKCGEKWPTISVDAASRFCWNFGESHVIDIGNKDLKSRFVSQDSPKQWIEISFGERWIKPTHYTIMSVPLGEGGPHMKSWSVSACSCVTGQYVEIDRQTDNSDLCGSLKQNTFKVARPLSDPVNSIRIEMLGKNHAGTDVLTLSKFEIYGKLFEPGKM